MDRGLDKQLIASFANTTEALAAQAALEAEGIPCEVGDLAQLPSPYLFGGLGSLGRSAGIWVLQVEDFPAIVTMDAHGESLHEVVQTDSLDKLKAALH